jgi:hypothetical protein
MMSAAVNIAQHWRASANRLAEAHSIADPRQHYTEVGAGQMQRAAPEVVDVAIVHASGGGHRIDGEQLS